MKRIIYIAYVICLVTAPACKKDLLDINKNPNAPANVDAKLVYPATLVSLATRVNNPAVRAGFDFSALWMGYIAHSGNFAINTATLSYRFTNAFEGGIWFQGYKNIADLQYVENDAAKTGNKFIEGTSKVIKALEYQYLVDIFNNIPYSTAAKGSEGLEFIKPTYDDAKTIYEDLIKQIDAGIALIKNPAAIPGGTVDIMFNGNKTSWVKFANTAKLRMLLRQSEMAGRTSYIQAEIAKIAAEGSGFIGAGGSAFVNPGYLNSAGKVNPWWGSNYNIDGLSNNSFYVANQYAISFYKDNNDPRLGKFYSLNPQGQYQGNYFGDQGIPNSGISFFGPGTLKNPSQPSIILSSAESYFLQAEAALRGWISGSAKEFYESAINESFKYLEVANATAAATTYYSQVNNKEVNYTACANDTERLALIIRQKWASLNLVNVIEAWNDYRRLKLPADIPLSKSPFAASSIPLRLLYPQTEYDYNPDNVKSQGEIDQFTSKIFWIK